MKSLVISVLFALSIFTLVTNCYEEKDGTIRVELMRQKSPKRQYLRHASVLKEHGTNFDYLFSENRNLMMNRTNDSIALYRYLDNEFYGVIVVGRPGQTMNVAFDTAWGLSWIMSAKCNTLQSTGCHHHHLYDNSRSSTWKKNGTSYFANEGDFNFTGFYSYDKFSIAHSNLSNYLFVEMTGVPDWMSLHKSDGVLGLGLKHSDYEPFFYALYRQKKIRDPIFSIYLNRKIHIPGLLSLGLCLDLAIFTVAQECWTFPTRDRQSIRGGNVQLGFIDKKHIHKTRNSEGNIIPDTIKYLPVTSGQYWEFAVDRIVVVPDHPPHNENVTLCPNGCRAMSNTGSNEIVGPPTDIDKIHDMINAQLYNGSWVVNCDTVNKLPKIDFFLGGEAFRLGGPNYIIKITTGPFSMCVSSFTTYPSNKDLWIMGGAFLSQYYSIYNIEDKTIGFVRAA